ncbi:MAG: glycine cleavage system protein GcvH [Candidatus Dormibacteria bacterium]
MGSDLSDLRFTATHEWVRVDNDTATVGITDHAQSQLGDVIFVDLPKVGSVITAGERIGTIESVKAASDLYAPVSGTILESNSALTDAPELINAHPYDDGWLIRIQPFSLPDTPLLTHEEYEARANG